MDGNKLDSHVADDSYLLDSFSFSGLVSVQDQQPKLPSNQAKHCQVSKHEPEFEFTSTKANLNSVVNPIKITPADQLISNGQLQPQALAFQTNQSLIINPPTSSSSLPATHSSSKMASRKTDSTMKYHELNKASKHTNKESTMTRAGFGQKIKSFLSPCRVCRTIKPGAVKAQTVPGGKFQNLLTQG